jgi:hypothetical protein
LYKPQFDGSDYEPEEDKARLTGQIYRVYEVMREGEWKTLSEISVEASPCPQASASAQLRNLRKKRFGGHLIEKKNMGRGLWKYRLVTGDEEAPDEE